jgi:hypothetical protein
MERWLKALIGAAIVLMIVVLAVLYKQVPRAKKPYERAEDQSGRFKILYGTSTIDVEKKDGAWHVRAGTSTATYPADAERMTSLFSSLSNVEVEEVISDRPDRAAEFEVTEASGTRVTAYDKKGKVWADGIFGKQAPNYSNLYFRYPDEATVYLARGLFRGELGTPNLDDWRSKALVNIAETDMKQITLTMQGKTLDLVRSSDTWTANGQKVNAAPVYGLIGTLAHLNADGFLDSTEGVRFDASTITVKGEKNAVTLHIGIQDVKAGRIPIRLDDGRAFWINASRAQSLQLTPKELGL